MSARSVCPRLRESGFRFYPLKNENARPLGVGRVVLNNDCHSDTVDHLTGEDTVLRHLIVSVRGDQNLAALDEVEDPTKRVAHPLAGRSCVTCPFKGERSR